MCKPVLPATFLTNANLPKSLPPHVRTVYEKAVPNLLLHQRRQLHSLLFDCANLFSWRPQDLVEHNINFGDALPLTQAPRRLPLAKREEVKMIGEMNQQALIEPSNSP